MDTATQLTPVKQTMWMLVQDILEKCYRIKVRERDLAEKLFWLSENEWKLTWIEQNWIEQQLFECRNTLDVVIRRMDEDINNLD